jgi:intracellular sulfur oxidation DsrE/DsrF family protein
VRRSEKITKKERNMNLISILLVLLAGSQITPSLAAAASIRRDGSHATANSRVAKHRIVFQVSVAGQEQWQGVLANVENLQKAFGPRSTQIEVVCFGKGIDMLLNTDAPLAKRIAKNHAAGVKFAACQNTLRARHLTPADLLPSASTVDSGVTEIVRKQEAGWAYIKGG